MDSIREVLGPGGHDGFDKVDYSSKSKRREFFYTKAQMLDAYEVLRQFVDLTDRMKGCFIAAMPSANFLDVEPAARGIGAYDALKFRVYDEVHDQRLVNPMGALIRLRTPESQA